MLFRIYTTKFEQGRICSSEKREEAWNGNVFARIKYAAVVWAWSVAGELVVHLMVERRIVGSRRPVPLSVTCIYAVTPTV